MFIDIQSKLAGLERHSALFRQILKICLIVEYFFVIHLKSNAGWPNLDEDTITLIRGQREVGPGWILVHINAIDPPDSAQFVAPAFQANLE